MPVAPPPIVLKDTAMAKVEDYFDYKLRVESALTGRNVHTIRGCLGRIMNGEHILKSVHSSTDTITRVQKMIVDSERDIFDSTGISRGNVELRGF